MRFGLEDGSETPWKKLAKSFADTRERIGQIEAKAAASLALAEVAGVH